MFGTGEFILQLRHLLFGCIQHRAELIRQSHISGGPVDLWTALQLHAQPVAQLIYVGSNLLKQWPSYAIALIEKSGEKMFVGYLRMIGLGRQVLCRLQCFLHLLCEPVDPHYLKITSATMRAIVSNYIACLRLNTYMSLRWWLQLNTRYEVR